MSVWVLHLHNVPKYRVNADCTIGWEQICIVTLLLLGIFLLPCIAPSSSLLLPSCSLLLSHDRDTALYRPPTERLGSMKSAQTSPSHFMVWWQECREGRHVQSRQTTNTSNYIDLVSFYVVSTSIEWRSSMKYLDIFRASPHPCWHLCDGNTCRPQTTGTQPASFLISISDSVTSPLTQPRKLDFPPYIRSDGTPGYCLETPADQHSFGLMVLW